MCCIGLIIFLSCKNFDGPVGFNVSLHELFNCRDARGACDLVHQRPVEIDGAFALGVTGALAAADSIINFLWKCKASRGLFRHLIEVLEKFTVLFQF